MYRHRAWGFSLTSNPVCIKPEEHNIYICICIYTYYLFIAAWGLFEDVMLGI